MDFCRLTVYQSPSCLNSCGLSCFYSTCSMVLLILFGHCLLNGYCIGLLSHLKPLNYPYFTVKIKKKYFFNAASPLFNGFVFWPPSSCQTVCVWLDFVCSDLFCSVVWGNLWHQHKEDQYYYICYDPVYELWKSKYDFHNPTSSESELLVRSNSGPFQSSKAHTACFILAWWNLFSKPPPKFIFSLIFSLPQPQF